MAHPDAVPYIITLSAVEGEAGAQHVLGRLRSLGVELDEAYGLIPLGPTPTGFVTRGMIPPNVAVAIAGDEQVALFPDLGIGPTAG